MTGSRRWEWERDRMEQLAEALHDGWWQFHRDQGWTLGPERDRERKIHPHLVAWSALDDSSRNQDRFEAAVLLGRWSSDQSWRVTPTELHEAWRSWIVVHGGDHPHAKPYADAHPQDDAQEHAAQAARVNELLERWSKGD